jgi:hypothetical protein
MLPYYKAKMPFFFKRHKKVHHHHNSFDQYYNSKGFIIVNKS